MRIIWGNISRTQSKKLGLQRGNTTMSSRDIKPDDAVRKLAQHLAPAALAALREMLKNKSTSDKDRVKAAELLLRYSGPLEPFDRYDWTKIPREEVRMVADALRRAQIAAPN